MFLNALLAARQIEVSLRVLGVLAAVWAAVPTTATASNALAECRALSDDPENIDVCLDNYLGDLDDNMTVLGDYIEEQLDGAVLESFRRAQLAFADYRRENCLWYFEFSTPRGVADQLAKDCLASMTQSRLTELQALLASEDEPGNEKLAGYYVYGGERNSFTACGSGQRYWVAGDRSAVGVLQQDYVAQATTERQRLYTLVSGQLIDEADAYAGHAGRLELDAVHELRVPTEADCRLPETPPGGTSAASAAASGPALQLAESIDVSELADTPDASDDEGPEQQLRAYFGEWQVDCTQAGGDYECRVSVAINRGSPALTSQALIVDAGQPRLRLIRRPDAVTRAELDLPGVDIENTAQIRWRIDELSLGSIAKSEVQRSGNTLRQVIDDPAYLDKRLIPELIDGVQLGIELVEQPGDASGQTYVATLIGVTRALAFAEDFVGGAEL